MKFLQSIRLRILTWPRGAKQAAMVVADVLSYSVAATVSLWVLSDSAFQNSTVLTIVALSVIVAIPVHYLFGLYASIVRYMGVALLAIGTKATLLVSTIVAATCFGLNLTQTPIKVGVVFWAFSLILVVGGRMAARMFLSRNNPNREPVVIYGAGQGGAQLAEALFGGDDYLPVAFVDEKSSLHGTRIRGLKVYPSSELADILVKTDATGVLLAIPSASRRRRRTVLQQLSAFPVRVQTMPEVRDIISGKARVDDISDVIVEDLLGRGSVPPNPKLLGASITDKSVMVTGAGGSIGSELCRQIVSLKPKRLVCFELSEAALYSIDKELKILTKRLQSDCEVVALLGSTHHEKRVSEALEVFNVQTIYHAAAYKHVPIVEHNLFEGLHNNVFGTLHTARAAAAAGVETFVLISTDKAVNPTSVMGATKRFAELILQSLGREQASMRCCMVRFGNVLESSGSVVPLFREQIRAGGPVTVTHRDIIRYFMTIPEAAQLVIQAASMAKGGDVFVLDMGDPVKIADLAHRMINLMGLSVQDKENPDGDIEIQYIGLRPAEKLYEELLIGSNVNGTEHPRIMRADEDSLAPDVLSNLLEDLIIASDRLDYDRAREILMQAVKEYAPNNGIDDLVWVRKSSSGTDQEDHTVVDFPKSS
jgi:FlaA1/EpsC-like NDP-sugar epimerase